MPPKKLTHLCLVASEIEHSFFLHSILVFQGNHVAFTFLIGDIPNELAFDIFSFANLFCTS